MTANNMPEPIKLDDEDAAKLAELHDQQAGLEQFMQDVIQRGRQEASQIVAKQRQLWQHLDQKYNLNLEATEWTLNQDGTSLVPTTVRLVPQQKGQG